MGAGQLGDERIARTQGGQTRYRHADGQGSTRALTDENGRETARWWCEAFGEVEESTGNSGNAFLFAGEQLDSNPGFYYLRVRYMDPSNGRFTQMDSFSGCDSDPVSLHKYLYVNASPVNYYVAQGNKIRQTDALGRSDEHVVQHAPGGDDRLFLVTLVRKGAVVADQQ